MPPCPPGVLPGLWAAGRARGPEQGMLPSAAGTPVCARGVPHLWRFGVVRGPALSLCGGAMGFYARLTAMCAMHGLRVRAAGWLSASFGGFGIGGAPSRGRGCGLLSRLLLEYTLYPSALPRLCYSSSVSPVPFKTADYVRDHLPEYWTATPLSRWFYLLCEAVDGRTMLATRRCIAPLASSASLA